VRVDSFSALRQSIGLRQVLFSFEDLVEDVMLLLHILVGITLQTIRIRTQPSVKVALFRAVMWREGLDPSATQSKSCLTFVEAALQLPNCCAGYEFEL
jgi:hypothetical protein